MNYERADFIRPSAAPRWMRCTASPAMSLTYPNSDNPYASDGRLTHRVSELCFRGEITAAEFPATLWFEENEHIIDEERRARVDAYVSRVRAESLGCAIIPEYEFEGLPAGQKGTGDAIVLGEHEGRTIVQVHDLKDGQMPVEVENNEQLLTYGCGAVTLLGEIFPELPDPEYVDLWIHMPKRGTAEMARVTLDELRDFAEYAQVRAEEAEGFMCAMADAHEEGRVSVLNATRDDIVARCNPGDKQCAWCPAAKHAACPAVERECVTAVVDDHIDWDTPSVEVLGDKIEAAIVRVTDGCDNAHLAAILPLLTRFEKWIEAVRLRARSELMDGNPVPGHKVVSGRAGKRFFVDADEVEAELKKMRIPKRKMFKTTLLSPAQLEKTLPRVFEKLVEKELVGQQCGAPCVVPESDKRPALTNVALEFDNCETANCEEGED